MGTYIEDLKAKFILNFIDGDRWRYLLRGLGNTLRITFVALLIGIAIGIVIAIVRSTYDKNYESMRSKKSRMLLRLADMICRIYLTVIRGTPVVIQLLIFYYVIMASSKNSILIASICFGLNSGAYVAEIIRGGIMSIDNGQFEAGRSLGFNYMSTMLYIIIPQVIRNILPSLANEFIVLLKETSVSGYVAVMDLTKGGDIIRGTTFSALMPLLAVALIYLVIVMFFTKLTSILERKLRDGQR